MIISMQHHLEHVLRYSLVRPQLVEFCAAKVPLSPLRLAVVYKHTHVDAAGAIQSVVEIFEHSQLHEALP